MAQNLLHGNHMVLKSFSQDVSALAQDIVFENKRMKLIQGTRLIFLQFHNQAFLKDPIFADRAKENHDLILDSLEFLSGIQE
jgi:hypothetical protein